MNGDDGVNELRLAMQIYLAADGDWTRVLPTGRKLNLEWNWGRIA